MNNPMLTKEQNERIETAVKQTMRVAAISNNANPVVESLVLLAATTAVALEPQKPQQNPDEGHFPAYV